MKCPLKREVIKDNYGNFYDNSPDCLKEECAWWRADIQMCAIKDLSIELGYTQMSLADMVDKMPHAGQFLK